jgi:hypothetical protein
MKSGLRDGFIVAAVVLLAAVGAQRFGVGPNLGWLSLLWLLTPALLAVLGLAFASARNWGAVVRLLSAGLIVLLAAPPTLALAWTVRRDRMEAVAIRSAPLVQAIERFEQEVGRAPRDLRELVPHYLLEVPGTGDPQHPVYHYERESVWRDQSWALLVQCPTGPFSFDVLLYLPGGGESALDSGGVERFGDWVYVHDS